MDRERVIKNDDLIPVKVRGRAYRLLKTVAAWRGVHMSDYLTEMILQAGGEDLRAVLGEIQEATEGGDRKPKK